MWANNETGAIQPIAEVVAIARRHGALVHSDAVQAAGRVAIDFTSAGLDLMTLSAHKLGGPSGAGALIVRDGLAPAPRNLGGGQELGRRSGTENLAGIAGFGAAAAVAADRSAVAGIAALRDGFEARLKAAAPEARILAADAPRLANTSCIAMPGVPAETQVMALDLAGIAVSAGAACSSGKVRRSHVLDAMEPGGSAAETAIRISLGWATEAADLDRLLDAWLALRARAGQRSVGHAA
jgi:cysteine desulfurase